MPASGNASPQDPSDRTPSSQSGPTRGRGRKPPKPEIALIPIAEAALAVFGLYANFFSTPWQATVALLDALAVSAIIWMLLPLRPWRGWRAVVLRTWRRAMAHGRQWLFIGGIAAILISLSNYTVFRLPTVASVGPAACMYDVPAQTSVPIVPGGHVEQAFRPKREYIDDVDPIIGLDPTLAHLQRPHRMQMRLRSADDTIDLSVDVPDISNNKSTVFHLPAPVKVEVNGVYYVDLFNRSDETVGIYTKRVGLGDIVDDPEHGILIDGQRGTSEAYREAGWALTACINGHDVT
jgi:hypothetical protein